MNYIYTKSISGITGQTLQAFTPTSVLLAALSGNIIKRITFIIEPNSNLTAQSNTQAASCFAEAGDPIKLAQNPLGATTNVFFEIDASLYSGDFLDLRTALKFTVTGTVHIMMFF